MTKLFARPRHSTRPLLSAEDLDKILNSISRAVLLVDKQDHQIISANSRAIELTAYTRVELISFDIHKLFDANIEQLMAMRSNTREATLPRLKLISHSLHEIRVTVQIESLGEKSPWALIIFEDASTRTQQKANSKLANDLLNSKLFALLSTIHSDNPEIALQEVLAIGGELIPESSLGVYIGKGGLPSVSLIKAVGEHSGIFPEEVSLPDLNHLLKATIWHKGQRAIVTLLHQSARASGLSYLATAPIQDAQEKNSWIGFLVACGPNPALNQTLQILELLAFSTAGLIQKSLLVKNLRQSISNSKERISAWDAVLENVKDGVITISPEFEVQTINPAAEIIFGYASKEIQKHPIENIIIGTDRLHPAILTALGGISTPSLGTVYLHRRDGSAFPAELEINPIRNESAIIGILIFIRDLSENEQIRLKTHQLEQRALLGEVTAIFAHEVRNPINNISMGLQLLERKLDASNAPQKERIQNMQEDCNRLTQLMDSVLTFSRTGTYSLNHMDVSDLLQRILQRWHPRFTKVNINYTLNAPDGLLPIMGDMRSLEQVFTNITSNAVTAMKETGGTFAVKISEINLNGSKSMIQIDLSDTGPGIPEDIQKKIFTPFFTTNTYGTGLGLAISKQIITAHKGSIGLTSFPGGTSFHVQLPATRKLEDAIV